MIQYILTLFEFGTVFFWIALFGLCSIMAFLSDRDKHVTKLVLFGTLLFLLWPQFISKLSVRDTIIGSIVYIAIGIVYSVVRWIISTKRVVSENKPLLKEYGITDLKELKNKKNIYVGYDKYHLEAHERKSDQIKRLQEIYNLISPQENKSKLTGYIFYWPWSIFKLLTADLAETVFDFVRNLYTKVVDYTLESAIR
jgi:hypothetical protein